MIDGTVQTASEPLELQLERRRGELTAYCYRMLGSAFEAEDAVQETFMRAWRSFDSFEGRAELSTWLYKIATNVCLSTLKGMGRRARPIDLGPAGTAESPLGERLPEATWIEPIPDSHITHAGGDPAATVEMRDSIRLAFVAALQHLAPKQRAVLVLRDVLKWKASEVAELLATTVVGVNSALQRARATLASAEVDTEGPREPLDERTEMLLALYVDAFERYDMDALTSLLHRDATWTMPPYELWLNSHEDIRRWCLGRGIGCRGSRLVPVRANASPAFAQYKPAADGGFDAWSLQVLEIAGGKIAGICFFLDAEWLFPLFGLPPRLPAEALVMRPRLVDRDEFAADGRSQ
ncbi:MAG: sigma-70 family RNA polymerase sigma factor [Actinomycetota bacterium]|nr:sigma-70 family RNA polymerase sigma factor [Actinomycetota bacterium]